MVPVWLAPILAEGLSLIGNAALAYGKGWVKEKTGVDLDKASLSKEDYLKLKQFELEHEEELIRLRQEDDKLSVAVEKMYLDDVDSARKMQQAALAQDDKYSKRFIYNYAWFWSIMVCVYLAFVTFGTIPKENIRFADTILGFCLGTLISTIVFFFFGTSRGSSKKDDTIRELLLKDK
jgi:hypothetical protein